MLMTPVGSHVLSPTAMGGRGEGQWRHLSFLKGAPKFEQANFFFIRPLFLQNSKYRYCLCVSRLYGVKLLIPMTYSMILYLLNYL